MVCQKGYFSEMRGQIVALFLVMLYLAAMLRPAAPALGYAMNRDFIAKVLCINQDRPEMKCNGACHLKKKVEETEKQDSRGLPSLIRIADYPVSLPFSGTRIYSSPEKPHFVYPRNRYRPTSDWSDEVFHPPA